MSDTFFVIVVNGEVGGHQVECVNEQEAKDVLAAAMRWWPKSYILYPQDDPNPRPE